MEAGLRISPETWSSQLYGTTNKKSEMQSIIDKVCTCTCISICTFKRRRERRREGGRKERVREGERGKFMEC